MNIVKQQKNKLEVLSALRCLILISHAVPAIGKSTLIKIKPEN
jgi:hypothetical protein